MKRSLLALALLSALAPALAAGPRAVEGAEPPADVSENCPPDMTLPDGSKLAFHCGPTGFAHGVTVTDTQGKIVVLYCKRAKVPLKDCGLGGVGWSAGGGLSGATLGSVLSVGAVDPFSAAVIAMTDIPSGQAWAGTIDGTGGPVTNVPGYSPWETPQEAAARVAQCQTLCTEAFGDASASCGLLGARIGGRAGAYASGFCTFGGAVGASICRRYC